MKWMRWRRSNNIEDYTDPDRPVVEDDKPALSISEILELNNSPLARDAGRNDIGKST